MSMPESEREFHRRIGTRCFNEAWEYLEKRERDAQDEQQMMHLAHASRYHWSLVGGPRNFAVADWQISRVYAALNQPSLALQFAKAALGICQKDNLEILCTAYEAMARAYAVAKDYESAKNYIGKAREQLRVIKDEEDRRIYSDQIRETEALVGP